MHRLRQTVQNAWANDFARHNAIMFGGNLAVSFLNYLYYPVLGRLLSTVQFGEVQALVSIFLQATLFLGVVSNVAVNVVSNEPDEAKRSRFTREMSRLSTGVTLVVVLIGLLFLGPIERFLRFDEPLPFILLGVTLVISATVGVQSAYLRGRSAFGKLSVNNFITAGGKLLISAGLVAWGWGTAGAIGGLLAAQILALLYVGRVTKRMGLLSAGGPLWRKPDLRVIRPQLGYTGLVLTVSLATTALFSVDTIIVKHFFEPELAGEYGGVATIARIIYFLTGSVALVLLSSVKLQASAAHNRRLLIRSALVQLGLGGAVLAVFTAAPTLVIEVLLGSRYLPLAHLLPLLGLTMFLLAAVNLIFSYDLALRRRLVAVYALAGVAATLASVLMRHDTPDQVVQGLLLGAVCMLLLRSLDSLRRLRPSATLRSQP